MRIGLAIMVCLFGHYAVGQTGFAYNVFTTEDGTGLNSNVVHTTYQDQKGFIWVGTANGLQRFDGSKFISFGSVDPASSTLPVSELRAILPFSKHELMLFFSAKMQVGIFNTHNQSFTRIPIKSKKPLPPKSHARLWKDAFGNFYITVYKYGILKLNTADFTFYDYQGFKIPRGWTIDVFSFEDTVTSRIWFPCPDSGLVLYDFKTKESYTHRHNPINHPILNKPELNPGVSEFFIDSKRRYWIFSWSAGHVYRCFSEDGSPLKDTVGLNENAGYNELRYFFETSRGVLWMYGLNALYTYSSAARKFLFSRGNSGSRDDIAYKTVYHIMEDADGSIWISTDMGLYFTSKLSGTWDIVNMNFTKGKVNLEITDLLQLQTGEFWLATWGSGIITLNSKFQFYKASVYERYTQKNSRNYESYDQTWCLHQDRKGIVWIGCQAGKYMTYDPVSRTTEFKTMDAAEQATIRYITEASDGTLFIGTQRGHVIRYNGGKFTTLHKFNTIVRKILIDNEGLLWVITEGAGLYCLSATGEKILQHYAADQSDHQLYQNAGYDLEQLNDSTILCAAGALNFINKRTGKVKWLTVDNGLPSNSVLRIRKDNFGFMWLITRNGLARYNPLNNRFTSYGRRDGVTLAHIANEADLLSNENFVMFAGGSALVYFKSNAFSLNQQPRNVTITDFILSGQHLQVDSLLKLPVIRLKDYQHSFTINFSSLSFLQSKKLSYYFRMKGAGTEWTRLNGTGSVNFAFLPPGKYEFEVYCETLEGVRSSATTVLRLQVLPPFWRTGWFWSSILTITLFVAYSIHRLRIHRIMAVETIRNRVARDLHDDMGSTLSTINILSSMAKARLHSDANKAAEYMNKISDNSQRMMEAMDDIVWAIKPANDSMHKVVSRMREFATNVFEAKEIDLEFMADEAVNNVNVNMEARRDLFLIFKESVNNAAKYSKCRKAFVHLFVEGKKLMLVVGDNGTGFDVKTADSGNGLGNMQKRADALKAKLEMTSKIGEGTTVKLSVPLN